MFLPFRIRVPPSIRTRAFITIPILIEFIFKKHFLAVVYVKFISIK